MRKPIFVFCWLAMMVPASLTAQGGYLQSLIIGSAGRGSVQVSEAEEGLDDFQNSLVESFGLRPKPAVAIQMNASKESPVLRRIAALQRNMDSTDLFFAVCRGAWEPDARTPEFAALVSPHREKITIDYLQNLMQFIPSLDGVLFIIPPPPQELSPTLFSAIGPGVTGGGKYIVVLRFRGQSDYPAVLEAFDDVIFEQGTAEQVDADKNGRISFSEWMSDCQHRLGKAFVVQVYKMTNATDLFIRQLQ